MTQYKITVDSKTLHGLLDQILQAEATEQLQAEPYERTDERQGWLPQAAASL